ncbi:Six-hairpin glycosidase-like protein [Astrocystis sublimbata]|nr:Six-hairpin glycosidase-like protein [Astrocystis sublimbata]
MRNPLYIATVVAALFGAPATATATKSCKPRHKDAQRMASSIMARGQGIMTGEGGSSEALQAGFVQKAFTALAAHDDHHHHHGKDAPWQEYVQKSAASTIPFLSNASNDALSYPMDRLSNGNALLALSSADGTAYRTAADALRESIHLNRRNSEGGLWYFVYPYWSYLDGMYSLGPFYSQYTLTSSSSSRSAASHLDDMLYQFDILWRHTAHAKSGLLSHGYDATRKAVWADSVTGASPYVWGRSLGWYTMALLDTLEILEKEKAPHKYRAPLLEKFQRLMPAVIKAVDHKTGGWWQIVDQSGREGNYIESSGTAMFSYSLLKGARLGYLPHQWATKAKKVGIRAQRYLTDHFVVEEADGTWSYNGTVAVCSLNSTATFEYYVNQPILYNSVLGSAAYVLASIEADKSR